MSHIKRIMTPTGPIAVIRPVAEQLLAAGVICGEIEGVLHAADATTVKAAMAVSGVCDFCSSPGATETFDVPDFNMPIPVTADPNGPYGDSAVHRSVDGWLACEPCAELVRAGRKKALVERSLEHLTFSKFTKRAIQELHDRFWKAMEDKAEAAGAAAALANFVENTLPEAYIKTPSDREVRLGDVARMVGLSREQTEALTHGEVGEDALRKIHAWSKRVGNVPPQKLIAQMAGDPRPLPYVVPHWQRALDAKFEAVTNVRRVMQNSSQSMTMDDAVDLSNPAAVRALTERTHRAQSLRDLGFENDAQALHTAQTYSFNGETIAAIREAAKSLPEDAPLASIETPAGCGWFWFGEPIPVSGTPMASDATCALLWSWSRPGAGYQITFNDAVLDRISPAQREELKLLEMRGGLVSSGDMQFVAAILRAAGVTRDEIDKISTPIGELPASVWFSAYILVGRGDKVLTGKILPSTRWYWPVDMSFRDMLAYNRTLHRRDYGERGQRLSDGVMLAGEDETLLVVAELSSFFVMSCLWFKQTVPILTREPGHIERHARKRYQREYKLDDPPTVQVVALRRTARVEREPAVGESEAAKREYHCRWIVAGHPRLQPVGPGRTERKLIWIAAYPKGPADKPLRTREKVYAVVR